MMLLNHPQLPFLQKVSQPLGQEWALMFFIVEKEVCHERVHMGVSELVQETT